MYIILYSRENAVCCDTYICMYLTVQYHTVSVRARFGYVVLDVLNLFQIETERMNSTKVQNPRHKMQVALLAEPKTPLELACIILYEH